MPTDTTITRYQPTILEEMDRDGGWLQVPACVPFPVGEFVRYEDHQAALTAAHAALANLPGHTCHVSGDDCGGCEYAWERDKRIAAVHAARDAGILPAPKQAAPPADYAVGGGYHRFNWTRPELPTVDLPAPPAVAGGDAPEECAACGASVELCLEYGLTALGSTSKCCERCDHGRRRQEGQ